MDHRQFGYNNKIDKIKNAGAPIHAHIIYCHRPHSIGHIWHKKWSNREWEYNSWRWPWLIDFPHNQNYIPLVLALHNSTAQETLAQSSLHRIYSLQIWSNYASTPPQTTVFRFTDLNDLLWFSDLVLGPYTSRLTHIPAMGG